ncbi:MAG: polysaccharide deacetylase family protein [Acidobacteria bacterium]|nr:polysaccharide deacetylase family protein [Acidobacteriota bacterium]
MPDLVTSIRRASPLLKTSLGVHGLAVTAILADARMAPAAAGALVANHVVLGLAGIHMRGAWLGPNITRVAVTTPDLALTFDDGPDPEATPSVLDLLDTTPHRATFFCIGTQAERHPDLVAEIRRRGHGVENHSYSHPNSFSLHGPRGMADEVNRAQRVLAGGNGQRPTLFRAPAGIQSPWLAGVLADAGLHLVSWTRRGFDTVTADARRVTTRLIGSGLRAGDILVLHDRNSRQTAGRPVVLEALPRVIDALDAAGLQSRPLHALLPAVAVSAPPGTR